MTKEPGIYLCILPNVGASCNWKRTRCKNANEDGRAVLVGSHYFPLNRAFQHKSPEVYKIGGWFSTVKLPELSGVFL